MDVTYAFVMMIVALGVALLVSLVIDSHQDEGE